MALQGCTPHDWLGMNLRSLIADLTITEHLTVSLSTRLKYFITQEENTFEIYDV